VETAPDGETGLEMIKSFKPQVVLLDLMLPNLSGVDVLKMIRSQPETQNLPVVVFSNTYLSNMVQEAWKAGATKCLSKANCTPKQVLEVVKGVLSAAHAAAPGATAAKPESNAVADAAFQEELVRSFVESLPATLSSLRGTLQTLTRTPDETGRVKNLEELYRKIHALTGNAGLAGMLQVSQMADALEALLKELAEKPRNINASTLRTVALAVDFLGSLFQHTDLLNPKTHAPISGKVLVVDDEVISQRAVAYALEKAKLLTVKMDDPLAALETLTSQPFDLVFLDVDMPGMNGFELCTKLRALPLHKKTPVVFVTSLTDFESRANSTISGGNDLIAKPFVFMELAVKALVYVLRARLTPAA